VRTELPVPLEPLAFLLGTWRGEGEGAYPGTDPVRYTEELSFEHVGDAFLLLTESSWTPEGEPLHFERGTGTVEGTAVTVGSTAVVRTAAGSPVTEVPRRYRREGDDLSNELDMATDGVARTAHIRATLRQV
jgi:hypothetical protein